MSSFSEKQDINSVLPKDLSNEEMKKLCSAFKDPKFSELFADYVKEISDPKQREVSSSLPV